jgi:hypothetical protein
VGESRPGAGRCDRTGFAVSPPARAPVDLLAAALRAFHGRPEEDHGGVHAGRASGAVDSVIPASVAINATMSEALILPIREMEGASPADPDWSQVEAL